jgi:hypothetical protein
MIESQIRSANTRVGQPFNPYRTFAGIFIPEGMVRSRVISAGSKLAYGRLLRYAGQDGKCYPAVGTLAAEIGLSGRQAQRYLAELESNQLVRRITRYRGCVQTSNGFEFLWHEILQDKITDRTAEGTETVAPLRVTDPSLHLVTDPSPKESQIEENLLSEYTLSVIDTDVGNEGRQADSGHASQKTDEGSKGISCQRVNDNQGPGIGCTAAMVASEERKPTPIWTDSDVTDVGNELAAFMDGEQPPTELLSWIIQFAEQEKLGAYDIRRALKAAWNRNGCPGRKNRPRSWKWFYEVLRAALRPGYAARLPEARSLNQFQQKKRHASRLPIQTPGGPI